MKSEVIKCKLTILNLGQLQQDVTKSIEAITYLTEQGIIHLPNDIDPDILKSRIGDRFLSDMKLDILMR